MKPETLKLNLRKHAGRVAAFVMDVRTVTAVLLFCATAYAAAILGWVAHQFTWTEAKPWITGAAFYASLGILLRLAWHKASIYKAQADKIKAETINTYENN